jgi:SAM-dependent methyltransferase
VKEISTKPLLPKFFDRILKKAITFRRRFSRPMDRGLPPSVMWNQRAKRHGVRGALNLVHRVDEIEDVTQMQKEIIFPHLESVLSGTEKRILDYGCGPGRFTSDLAKLIRGTAIGVDPTQHFLNLAPQSQGVAYRLMRDGIIPLEDKYFDVVWICLVLGGLLDNEVLRLAASEVERVLKTGGILILVENTSNTKDGEYWKYRSVDFYSAQFEFANLVHKADYYDLDERISIMVGRKSV